MGLTGGLIIILCRIVSDKIDNSPFIPFLSLCMTASIGQQQGQSACRVIFVNSAVICLIFLREWEVSSCIIYCACVIHVDKFTFGDIAL